MITLLFFILGLCTTLLFPPYHLFPLGFIIFPLICYLFDKKIDKFSRKKNFINFFIYGLGFFGSLLFWIRNPFFVFDETSSIFYVSILLIVLISFIFSLVSVLIFSFNKYLSSIFIVPIMFTLFESIISITIYGFPWITFSLIISNINIFNIFLKNYGTLVTAFFVIQIFCLPYLITNNFKISKKIISYLSLISAPLILILINNIHDTSKNKYEDKLINFEIFQINKPTILSKNSAKYQFEKILSLISKSDSSILIFAENNYPLLINDLNFKKIRTILKDEQSVIIGGTRVDNNNYYNSIFNISKKNVTYFDKKILVPFGEFLPFRDYFNFLEKISGPSDYKSGVSNRYIKISTNLNFIPIICYEIIFYWKLISNYNFDSDLIINITNDTWFGKFLGPYQHLYLTKLRAIEFNKPIIRVSNNGISAIIDNNGLFVKNTNLYETTSIKINKFKITKNITHFYSHKLANFYFFIIFIILIFINIKIIYEDRKSKT